jgi:hypothetical protein
MTEIKERYETAYARTPEGTRWAAYREFRDALGDLVAHVGPLPDEWTAADTERVNRDLTVCIAALWMFEECRLRVARPVWVDDTDDSAWGAMPDE